MNPLRIPLQIVFYQEDETWFAHCLNLDVLGDGKTKDEAMESLSEAIAIQIEATLKYQNPHNLVRSAPDKYWEMFYRGDDLVEGEVVVRPLPLTSQ